MYYNYSLEQIASRLKNGGDYVMDKQHKLHKIVSADSFTCWFDVEGNREYPIRKLRGYDFRFMPISQIKRILKEGYEKWK
ncbi:MAG: hypothetical protein ACTSR3_00955 [Candidatus Helarchaeota archaeon]